MKWCFLRPLTMHTPAIIKDGFANGDSPSRCRFRIQFAELHKSHLSYVIMHSGSFLATVACYIHTWLQNLQLAILQINVSPYLVSFLT